MVGQEHYQVRAVAQVLPALPGLQILLRSLGLRSLRKKINFTVAGRARMNEFFFPANVCAKRLRACPVSMCGSLRRFGFFKEILEGKHDRFA